MPFADSVPLLIAWASFSHCFQINSCLLSALAWNLHCCVELFIMTARLTTLRYAMRCTLFTFCVLTVYMRCTFYTFRVVTVYTPHIPFCVRYIPLLIRRTCQSSTPVATQKFCTLNKKGERERNRVVNRQDEQTCKNRVILLMIQNVFCNISKW